MVSKKSPIPPSPKESIDRLRQTCALLTPDDLAAVTVVSQQLQDGENVYAQSLTGALRLAQMFGCERAVLHQVEFARAQPQLFNVFLGAALALTLNKDMARGHYEILVSPLATLKRLAWLKGAAA